LIIDNVRLINDTILQCCLHVAEFEFNDDVDDATGDDQVEAVSATNGDFEHFL